MKYAKDIFIDNLKVLDIKAIIERSNDIGDFKENVITTIWKHEFSYLHDVELSINQVNDIQSIYIAAMIYHPYIDKTLDKVYNAVISQQEYNVLFSLGEEEKCMQE